MVTGFFTGDFVFLTTFFGGDTFGAIAFLLAALLTLGGDLRLFGGDTGTFFGGDKEGFLGDATVFLAGDLDVLEGMAPLGDPFGGETVLPLVARVFLAGAFTAFLVAGDFFLCGEGTGVLFVGELSDFWLLVADLDSLEGSFFPCCKGFALFGAAAALGLFAGDDGGELAGNLEGAFFCFFVCCLLFAGRGLTFLAGRELTFLAGLELFFLAEGGLTFLASGELTFLASLELSLLAE